MIAIKKRKLSVQGVTDQPVAQALAYALEELVGVTSASVTEGGRLRVEYDLFKIDLDRLERELGRLGHPASTSHWQRLKRWWGRYTESNERDNLTAPVAPCCSNPRGILDRKR